MQQLKERNPLYLESASGEKYTNPFCFFSSCAAPIEKKALYGKFSHACYRIGARYYDPDIGLWISPDAMRQYHSLYDYCSGNPINCIDKDGNAGGGLQYQIGVSFGRFKWARSVEFRVNHDASKSLKKGWSVGLSYTKTDANFNEDPKKEGVSFGLKIGSGLGYLLNNFDHVDQAAGPSKASGLSADLGPFGIGGEYNISVDENGEPIGNFEISIEHPGILFPDGVGIGSDVHMNLDAETKNVISYDGKVHTSN